MIAIDESQLRSATKILAGSAKVGGTPAGSV
jgi:hypothetical protein